MVFRTANAQRIARVGPSNVTRKPSPLVSTSRPWYRPSSRRTIARYRCSSSSHLSSPSAAAVFVAETMSMNKTVATVRLAPGPPIQRGVPFGFVLRPRLDATRAKGHRNVDGFQGYRLATFGAQFDLPASPMLDQSERWQIDLRGSCECQEHTPVQHDEIIPLQNAPHPAETPPGRREHVSSPG
jgi:hypothetical protein